MASASTEVPDWVRGLGARLPRGVRIEDQTIVDEVSGFSAPLDAPTAERLRALESGTELASFLERYPDAWPVLAELNRAHMLNFHAWGWRIPAASACHRLALGEGKLRAPVTLLRAMGHFLRARAALLVLFASAGALVMLATPSPPVAFLLILVHALCAYWTHELGHALAAVAMGVPAYVLVDRQGLSVWARLAARPAAARLFAASGPCAAILAGSFVLLVLEALGSRSAPLHALPYFFHLLALIPPAQDGRVLWAAGRRGSEEVSA